MGNAALISTVTHTMACGLPANRLMISSTICIRRSVTVAVFQPKGGDETGSLRKTPSPISTNAAFVTTVVGSTPVSTISGFRCSTRTGKSFPVGMGTSALAESWLRRGWRRVGGDWLTVIVP
jgi:hypothetical protein